MALRCGMTLTLLSLPLILTVRCERYVAVTGAVVAVNVQLTNER